MLTVAAAAKAPLVLMHITGGTPKTMLSSENKQYHNVVGDVARYLLERAGACAAVGLGRDKVILDPGLGFAKDRDDLALCNGLAELTGQGIPVLAGSRKGFIGRC